VERWVCDYCGAEGRTREDELAEHVQCPVCGEPVTRLPG
jgi:rubrerythrin